MADFAHASVTWQRTQEELQLLQRIALAIHEAEDLNAALVAVLQGVCESTGWTFGQAWLPQSDAMTLVCSSAWYVTDPALSDFRRISQQFAFGPGEGLPGLAWSTQQPIWSANVTLNPTVLRGAFAQEFGLKAAMAIPVLAKREVVAVLEFFVFEDRSEDQHLMTLVSAVAAQLGLLVRRKQAEEALRRSEARYRAVVDTASDAIVTMTADGTIRSFNRGAERAFGYNADDVIGQSLTMLIPERLREQHLAGLRSYLETGKQRVLGRTVEVAGLRSDGNEFPLELTITVVQEEDSQFFAAILRDITRRKLTETMLERQTETLRWQAQLLDLVHDAILVRTFDSNQILFWNEGAEQLYGWSAVEALGQSPRTLLQTELPQPIEVIEAALLTVERWQGELIHTTRDGRRIVVASRWSVRRNEQGEPASVLQINTDITERKQAEQERARLLAAEQEHTKRLRELATLKADFTAMVAHELDSPLAAIRIFADLLAGGLYPAEQQAQMIGAIRSEVRMLTALVADVRASAAVERDDFAVQMQPVALSALLAGAATFASTLPGDHPVTVAEIQSLVRADADRISQVLRNLLSNAAKYTPPGTPIEVCAIPAGRRIRIEVIDSGPGIHPNDLKRIFEKFGRGRDQSGKSVAGVGLGLYLSRRIVQAHGAELEVYSTPGVGSVFAFELEVVT
jgi:PAS domain S-box-containing protein